MAYLIAEHLIEESSIIEMEAEAVLQRIYDDGVGLYELMESMDKGQRDNLDCLLVRFIQAEGDRKIFTALQSAAEVVVRLNQ